MAATGVQVGHTQVQPLDHICRIICNCPLGQTGGKIKLILHVKVNHSSYILPSVLVRKRWAEGSPSKRNNVDFLPMFSSDRSCLRYTYNLVSFHPGSLQQYHYVPTTLDVLILQSLPMKAEQVIDEMNRQGDVGVHCTVVDLVELSSKSNGMCWAIFINSCQQHLC